LFIWPAVQLMLPLLYPADAPFADISVLPAKHCDLNLECLLPCIV